MASLPNAVPTAVPNAGGLSISLRDKKLLQLQEDIESKKKQLKDDYRQLKNSVNDNPHLQAAIDEYDKYFLIVKQKIQALKTLLRNMDSKSEQREIKKEIADLEKSLA
jgi:hypothetical protein